MGEEARVGHRLGGTLIRFPSPPFTQRVSLSDAFVCDAVGYQSLRSLINAIHSIASFAVQSTFAQSCYFGFGKLFCLIPFFILKSLIN